MDNQMSQGDFEITVTDLFSKVIFYSLTDGEEPTSETMDMKRATEDVAKMMFDVLRMRINTVNTSGTKVLVTMNPMEDVADYLIGPE